MRLYVDDCEASLITSSECGAAFQVKVGQRPSEVAFTPTDDLLDAFTPTDDLLRPLSAVGGALEQEDSGQCLDVLVFGLS